MKKPIKFLALTAAMISGLLSADPVRAEYKDPIDLSVEPHPAARQSLQLDIFRAGSRVLSVGQRGYILYSDDQGANWQQARVESRAHLNSVTFADDRHGWAVGEDQVIVATADGGETWQRQYDGRDAEFKGPLLSLLFKDKLNGIAIGVYNKVFTTSDGGRSWNSSSETVENPDEWHLFDIASSNGRNIYIASEQGLLFISRDGGSNFKPVQIEHEGSFHGLLVRKGSDGKDQIAAFGVGGFLYTSIDGGENWTLVDTGTNAGLAGGTWLDDGSAVIVGADGVQVRLSEDLNKASASYREDGLPMNAVMQMADGSLLQSGLFGLVPGSVPSVE